MAPMVNTHHHCSRFFGFGNGQRSHGFFILSFIFFFLKGYYRTVDGPVFSSVWFLVAKLLHRNRIYLVRSRYAYQVRVPGTYQVRFLR